MSTPNNRGNNRPTGNNNNNENKPKISFLPVVLLAIVFVLLLNFLYDSYSESMMEEINYNEFIEMLQEDEVAEVELQADRILILSREMAEVEDSQRIIYYTGRITSMDASLVALLESIPELDYYQPVVDEMSPLISLLISYVVPFGIMILLFNFLMKNVGGKMGGSMSIGQSKAKVYMEKETGVTFADVAGQENNVFRIRKSVFRIHALICKRCFVDQYQIYLASDTFHTGIGCQSGG